MRPTDYSRVPPGYLRMPPAVRAPASDARRAVLGVTGDMSVDLIGNPAVARGPWGFWLRLVMPPARATGRQDASQRELLRRARLMSIFLLVGFTVTLGLAPEIFLPSFDAAELAVVGTAFVMLVVAALLNRAGYVAGGASLLIASVIAAVAANQLTYPGGLPVTGRTAFDLFVIPILLAGVLLPRNAAIVCWAGVSAFIYLDLLLGPKQQDLIAFIAQQGIYTVAATPIVLLGAVAAVAWVAAGSVRQALREADRTRELERAYAYIADQKQQLEVAIAAIQQVHAQAANGDLTVRAPVTTSALAPLAVSLNLMLDRLSQARGMEVAMGSMEQRLQRLEHVVESLAQAQLRDPVPVLDMGRLTPLAQRLEQLRAGILSAFQYSAELAERASSAFEHYRGVVYDRMLSGQGTPGEGDLDAMRQAEVQVEHTLSLCGQFARRFAR